MCYYYFMKAKRVLSKAGKILLFSSVSLVFIGISYILGYIFIFMIPHKVLMSMIPLIPAVILIYGAAFINSKTFRRVVMFSSLGCAVVSIVLVSVFGGIDLYYASHRIVDNSNINTDEYLPFDENSKIARLDHEASFKLSTFDYLPKVDGAAALFPMYSSFVNATYPRTIPPLNAENGCFYYTNTYTSIMNMFEGNRDLVFGVDPENYRKTLDQRYDDIEIFKEEIGREGFVFFTHKNTSVDSLTIDQLKDIYSGNITNWKDVGGQDMKISLYHRNTTSGSYQGLRHFLGDIKLAEAESPDYIVGLMSGIIKIVADYINHPGAIGYSYYQYASELMANDNIKILKVNGIEANRTTIKTNEYPFTSSFYMFGRVDHVKPTVTSLMNWIKSSEGQELVSKSGYTSIY